MHTAAHRILVVIYIPTRSGLARQAILAHKSYVITFAPNRRKRWPIWTGYGG